MYWIQHQIEWLKSFFSETYDYKEDKSGKASSKRLIELGVIWTFIVGFMKVILYMSVSAATGALIVMPDIPWGWATLIFGILGLKVYENLKGTPKNGNGNGNGNVESEPPKPPEVKK